MNGLTSFEDFKAALGFEFIIKAENTTNEPQEIMIFGAEKDLADEWIPKGIDVYLKNHPALNYAWLKDNLLKYSIRVLGLELDTNKEQQYSNRLEIYDEKAGGALERRIWQPMNYRMVADQKSAIKAPAFELLVLKTVYIKTILNPYTWITFHFMEVKQFVDGQNPFSQQLTNLNFSQALEALKSGRHVCRDSWGTAQIFLSYINPFPSSDQTPYNLKKGLLLCTDNGNGVKILTGWGPTPDDIFAEDYYIRILKI
jgi:hypothetical protein